MLLANNVIIMLRRITFPLGVEYFIISVFDIYPNENSFFMILCFILLHYLCK